MLMIFGKVMKRVLATDIQNYFFEQRRKVQITSKTAEKNDTITEII